VPQAVEAARRAGASRVVVASYLLAPGWFHHQLRRAGADVVSGPLGADRRVVATAVERWAAAAGASGADEDPRRSTTWTSLTQ
jgi:hypothetical protein